MSHEPDRQDLEDRIDELEQTVAKMLPSRRDALKLGGAALVGGAAMSGAATAQPGDDDGEAGVIGTDNKPVDIEASDIEVDDLVVNGTATGPFGGGGILLEAGDSITVATIADSTVNSAFEVLYSGTAKDVIGGVINARGNCDFLYTFSDSSSLRKNGSGTNYSTGNFSIGKDRGGDQYEVDFLPPAKNVTKIEVGSQPSGSSTLGAEVILKD